MRKFLALAAVLLLMSSCAWAETAINTNTFPDELFRGYVHGKFDTNNDNILQDSEIAAVVSIDVKGLGISSLQGIEHFTNLTLLDCSNNSLTELDLTALTKLREVKCTYSGLSSLNVSRCSALENLVCFVNSLDVLDVTHNTALVSLDCQENNLSAIDVSYNPRLKFLDCSDNNITSLNLDANPELRYLYCRDLNLGTLNVSKLPELHHLWCWNNGLSELDLSNNTKLESLMCYGNNLTELNINDDAPITELACAGLPLEDEYLINTILPLEVDAENGVTLNVNQGYGGLNSDDIVAIDEAGRPVNLVQFSNVVYSTARAVFDKAPTLIKYDYHTANEKVKLSVSYISEAASAVAPASNGIFVGTVSGDVLMWKGIPYAKSPTGSLRWKAPEAPDESSEVYSAVNFAPTPIQHTSSTNPVEIMPRGEDCLALNVWTNGRSISDPKPVMVWIHGGAFNSGGTANPDYNGQPFIEAHDDVVLVSIGYRVGIMGFIDFANSGIPGGEDFPDSGNLGLLDMLQALRWIQDNIAAFGGDPNNVTVFGQSSGSACVALLMAMPESRGLFQKAITESGAVSMTSSVADCLPLTQALVQLTSADTMTKLMALSSSDLLAAAEQLQAYTNFPERDGRIVAEDPYTAFATNSANFDVLAGSNADEVNYWSLATGAEGFGQLIQMGYYGYVSAINSVSSEDAAMAVQFIEQYKTEHETSSDVEAMSAFLNDLLFRVPTVAEMNSHSGKRYVYYWEYPSGIPGIGACHSLEIPYVFNSINHFVPFQINQNLAATVQDMWINFAKTGNPSTDSITWPEYDTSTQATMIITESPSVRNANLAERYALIQPLLKYRLSGRELISGIAALSGSTDTGEGSEGGDNSGSTGEGTTTDPNSGNTDNTPNEQGTEAGPNRTDSNPTIPAPANDPGKQGGGCNAGFTFTVILAGVYLALRRNY